MFIVNKYCTVIIYVYIRKQLNDYIYILPFVTVNLLL